MVSLSTHETVDCDTPQRRRYDFNRHRAAGVPGGRTIKAGGRTMNAPTTAEALGDLRETVCMLHRELVRWGLVTWTSGNISGRAIGADQMVIKPSGIAYDDLTPESMVVTDMHGRPVDDGSLVPSSDTHSHAYIYHRDARGQRDRAHPQHVRHSMGGPTRGDPVRPHRDGRRVRRPDPGRSIRPDRRRRDRPRRGVHAPRPSLTGRAVGQSRRLRHRPHAEGRRQSGGDVRGRRPHRSPRMVGDLVTLDPADVDSLYERYQSAYGQK